MTNFKYRAFISYSWADASWGQWLQRRLETYRTPAALVGKDGAYGPVSPRLHPIFRDREDQSAGASISASLVKGLAVSEFLIVICSPNSAKSQWCEQEIAWFKANRDPDKILALIVDGEPGDAESDCFPKALTHRVNDDLSVSDETVDAPLAADARISGDGKRKALLKVIAAMLGIGLDELVNRDERRRTIRTRVVVGASLALALVMSGLTIMAIQARDEADFQRNEADGLVEFMLTDLRDKLEPVGRLDALGVVGGRALEYYAKQKLASLDADALGRRARALLLVGEISNLRGDSEEALKAFEQAAATTREQLARDPDNQQRIYDHAQSAFWVGAIAYGRGETETAEQQFREYKRLADRLVQLDPGKPEWQMESSYAETNLGVMYKEQGRLTEAEPALARALERIEVVAAKEEFDPGRQIELGTIVNWLGMVRGDLGKTRNSLAMHEKEIAIYRGVLSRDPANTQAKNRLSIAEQFVGGEKLNQGDIEGAIDAYRRSLSLNGELRALEPENTDFQDTEVRARLGLADHLWFAGRNAESRAMLDQASVLLDRLVKTDPTNDFWSNELRLSLARHRGRMMLAGGDLEGAAKQTRAMIALVEAEEGKVSEGRAADAYLIGGDVLRRQGRGERAADMWRKGLEKLGAAPGSSITRFALLRRTGREEEAAQLAQELDRRGFRHPAYLAER